MASRGVWQLSKLKLHYCPFSGSSRGAREFVQHFLPLFEEQNSQLAVETVERRGQHPFWTAQYKNGNRRLVDVKNQEMEEILRHAHILRSCHGRTTKEKVRWRWQPSQVSVQGKWEPGMFEKQAVQP
mmetsp:Transcript_22395/g.39967  ORF Transcript_22395/g.39967 Transcript_22395/m.39967 type:complete len:127 (-) Transcript_22395:308-688(-)